MVYFLPSLKTNYSLGKLHAPAVSCNPEKQQRDVCSRSTRVLATREVEQEGVGSNNARIYMTRPVADHTRGLYRLTLFERGDDAASLRCEAAYPPPYFFFSFLLCAMFVS